jgi:hypothetical protein
MATRAAYVIAKGSLAEFCRAKRLPHATFVSFQEVIRHLADWLDRPAAAGASRAGQGQVPPSPAASTY